MPRPRKATVDYFPHFVRHGKTLTILEKRFGNDGYALYFKLLETLGDTEGHGLDCNDSITWEYLLAKTHLESGKCTAILNMLAQLGTIDPELWERKIIWCQEFVEDLTDLYARRKVGLPSREQFCPINDDINRTETPVSRITDGINPQRKEKNRTGEESIENETPPGGDTPAPKKSKRKTGKIPENFGISDRVRAWAKSRRISESRLKEHFDHFVLKAKAKGYEFEDWDAALMMAIEENWGNFGSEPPRPPDRVPTLRERADPDCEVCKGQGYAPSKKRPGSEYVCPCTRKERKPSPQVDTSPTMEERADSDCELCGGTGFAPGKRLGFKPVCECVKKKLRMEKPQPLGTEAGPVSATRPPDHKSDDGDKNIAITGR